jgi:hypothetical protein
MVGNSRKLTTVYCLHDDCIPQVQTCETWALSPRLNSNLKLKAWLSHSSQIVTLRLAILGMLGHCRNIPAVYGHLIMLHAHARMHTHTHTHKTLNQFKAFH